MPRWAAANASAARDRVPKKRADHAGQRHSVYRQPARQIGITLEAGPDLGQHRPVAPDHGPRFFGREVVGQARGGKSTRAQALEASGECRLRIGGGDHLPLDRRGPQGDEERIHDGVVPRAARDAEDTWSIRRGNRRDGIATKIRQLAEPHPLLARVERAERCREHAGGQDAGRRGQGRHAAPLGHQERQPLRNRCAAQDDDPIRPDLPEHVLEDAERLDDLHPKHDAPRYRQEVREPDAPVVELGRRFGGRQRVGDEACRRVPEGARIDLVRFFVVVTDADPGWKARVSQELARRQERDRTARALPFDRADQPLPVPADIALEGGPHPAPPEFAVAPRGFGDEERAVHGTTTVPALTLAPFFTVTPGTTSAPIPRNAPASIVTLPARMTPGER